MAKESRMTRQKEILEAELSSFSSFFNAQELHKRARRNDPTIGIATIYRYLKELRKCDEVCIYSCDRKAIYSRDKKSHSHFICEKCGKREHILIDNLDFVKKKIKGEICHFQVDVHGVCDLCSRRR